MYIHKHSLCRNEEIGIVTLGGTCSYHCAIHLQDVTTHVRCALPYRRLLNRTWNSAVLQRYWQVPDSAACKHLPTVLRTLKSFHPVKRRLSFVVLLYLLQVLLCHSLLCPLRSPWRRRMMRRKKVDNRRKILFVDPYSQFVGREAKCCWWNVTVQIS